MAKFCFSPISNCSKMAKIQFFENCNFEFWPKFFLKKLPKWLKIAQNGEKMPQKWPNFAFRQFQIAQKWPKFEFFEKKKLQKRLEIAQNGEIWPKKLTFLKKKNFNFGKFSI